jgi:hypothetical protein
MGSGTKHGQNPWLRVLSCDYHEKIHKISERFENFNAHNNIHFEKNCSHKWTLCPLSKQNYTW